MVRIGPPRQIQRHQNNGGSIDRAASFCSPPRISLRLLRFFRPAFHFRRSPLSPQLVLPTSHICISLFVAPRQPFFESFVSHTSN